MNRRQQKMKDESTRSVLWFNFYGFVSLYSDVTHSIVPRQATPSAQTFSWR